MIEVTEKIQSLDFGSIGIIIIFFTKSGIRCVLKNWMNSILDFNK